jgi:hypothetical protein
MRAVITASRKASTAASMPKYQLVMSWPALFIALFFH